MVRIGKRCVPRVCLARRLRAPPRPCRQWPSIWFKAGSGEGAETLAYLATNRTGRTYVVTVLTENPSAPIPRTSALPILVSAVKGAFALAAR
jgi:hypothetical protein